jgi:hypothetical protein
MKIIAVDEKWSVRYDPENNDRPIAWLRYGVESHPFDQVNAVTAMFYTILDDRVKLAKAMEALRFQNQLGEGLGTYPRAVLAKLEGKE